FQNHAEVYFSYGNTNLGASNDQAERLAYMLGGVGDDKTDIVVYAEWYDRDAIYSRDRDISIADPSEEFAGHVGDFVYQPNLNRGALTPTPHSQINLPPEPEPSGSPLPDIVGQYKLWASLPQSQQFFNVNALTPAMVPVDREYVYGSFDRKIFDQYL